MKWRRNVPRRDCRRQPLMELIRDELTPAQCDRLESHLSQCEACQQRLTKLTADNQWWLDASRWLDPAAADCNSLGGALDGESVSAEEVHHCEAERALLESGLLRPTAQDGSLGTLGRYEVRSVLGAGGTGVVLKAVDSETLKRSAWIVNSDHSKNLGSTMS